MIAPVSHDRPRPVPFRDRKSERQRQLAALDVLVVEDSTFIRKLIRGLLLGIGIHKITEAADGLAALWLLDTFQPDIILLDLEMPRLNGLQFVRRLRERDGFGRLAARTLFLTAHAERERVLYAKDNGIGGFVAKPMSANVLRGYIISILNKTAAAERSVPAREPAGFAMLD